MQVWVRYKEHEVQVRVERLDSVINVAQKARGEKVPIPEEGWDAYHPRWIWAVDKYSSLDRLGVIEGDTITFRSR